MITALQKPQKCESREGSPADAKETTERRDVVADAATRDKPFHELQAQFALRGHSFLRTPRADGSLDYFAERWGLVRYLPTLDDARRFLALIGGEK